MLLPVFASWGGPLEIPRGGGPWTTEMHGLTVGGAASPRSRCQQGWVLLRAVWGISSRICPASGLLAISGIALPNAASP